VPAASHPTRFAELHAQTAWRTVDFISDLHLQASDTATFDAFCRYLRDTPADALFILGDLFEVWIGDDAAQPGSFEARCGEALHSAAQRLPVYFMHGNRDFLLGNGFLRESGMQGLSDPTVLVFGGERLLLSHGDVLCLDDVDYLRFREQVRDPVWQAAFLARPLEERRAFARGIRGESEARKHLHGVAYTDLDASAARAWLQDSQAATLVHGHTHRPAVHDLGNASSPLQRVVLSDWDAEAHPPRLEALRWTRQGRWQRVAAAST
jgi:UDP-2,3-diacylglucosamine hydrolase